LKRLCVAERMLSV